MRVPETREMLLRRMRSLLDRWWQPPGTPWAKRVLEQHVAQMTSQMGTEAALDRIKWGNPWTLPGNTRPPQALNVGVRELVDRFIEPRRRHFYVTHSITNSGRPVGLTSRHRAGIPEPQPSDARVEWGEINLCPTNRSLEFLCLTNCSPFAVDLSGWRLDGAVKFTFEGGTVAPARGLLYVSPDVKAFRSRATADGGRVRFVVGNYSGRLDRARPTVLKNVAGRTIVER